MKANELFQKTLAVKMQYEEMIAKLHENNEIKPKIQEILTKEKHKFKSISPLRIEEQKSSPHSNNVGRKSWEEEKRMSKTPKTSKKKNGRRLANSGNLTSSIG